MDTIQIGGGNINGSSTRQQEYLTGIGVFDVYIERAVAGPFAKKTETSIYLFYARQALASLSVLKVAIKYEVGSKDPGLTMSLLFYIQFILEVIQIPPGLYTLINNNSARLERVRHSSMITYAPYGWHKGFISCLLAAVH